MICCFYVSRTVWLKMKESILWKHYLTSAAVNGSIVQLTLESEMSMMTLQLLSLVLLSPAQTHYVITGIQSLTISLI